MTEHDYDPAGDIETLRALKQAEDGRTIDEMIAADEYEVAKVTKVEAGDGGWFFITTDEGFGTGVKGAEPKVGDTVWLYTKGFGGGRYGWALNGKLIEWQTPWERFAERIRWLADYDRRQREDFARQRADLDAKYEALPRPLKLRIDRFRRESPSFRVDTEAYEMAAVADAPKIASAIATNEGWDLDDDLAVIALADESPEAAADRKDVIEKAVKAFYELGHDEQVAMVSDLEPGHSGNTFGGAVSLAYGLLSGSLRDFETSADR